MVQVKNRQKRLINIILLKDEIKVLNKYPCGKPPGLSPEEVQKQREAQAEQKRKEVKLLVKHKQGCENTPMQLYLKDVKSNLARDLEFYWSLPAPACMQPEFLESKDKKALDAARAVWLKRFGSQLADSTP